MKDIDIYIHVYECGHLSESGKDALIDMLMDESEKRSEDDEVCE